MVFGKWTLCKVLRIRGTFLLFNIYIALVEIVVIRLYRVLNITQEAKHTMELNNYIIEIKPKIIKDKAITDSIVNANLFYIFKLFPLFSILAIIIRGSAEKYEPVFFLFSINLGIVVNGHNNKNKPSKIESIL